jgi:uncharacterized protein
MKNILEILKEIETKNNITILYACETGSRAWGFASPDSDYDIRFIYKHNVDWYLSLGEKKDYINLAIKEDLDITGWDIRKSLHLLKKSNAALIERFQSPIEYFAVDNFKNDFKNLINEYYSPIAVFYHHYSLAKNFREDIVGKDEIKLKSYFYLVRSLLSCNWVIKSKEVVPMDIESLLAVTSVSNQNILRELIKLKATVGEKYLHKADDKLMKLVIELFDYVDTNKDNLKANNSNYESIDTFFLKTIL